MSLVELTSSVHRALDDAGIEHAFGGALALAYVAEPRGTVDIDVNVFIPVSEMGGVVDAFETVGLAPEEDPQRAAPIAGIRFRRADAPFPVDAFPSVDPDLYAETARRRVKHQFGPDGELLPFLGADDLVVFKLSFGRGKDWVDLRSIAEARPDLDLAYIETQLLALRGHAMYPRIARFRELVRAAEG